ARGVAARQVGRLHHLRDLRAAERGQAGEGLPRGGLARAEGRLRREGDRGGEVRLAAVAPGHARAGPRARADARGGPLLEAHARLGRRLREEGRGADRRPDRVRDAQVSRSREDDDRQGGGFRERVEDGWEGRIGSMNRGTAQGAWALALVITASTPAAPPPTAKKAAHTTTVHGDQLEDDYFWLRERENPEVKAYLEKEN